MKKLFFIFIMMAFVCSVYSQQHPATKTLANYVKIDKDTLTYSQTFTEAYTSNFFIVWTHNADSIGFVMQQSSDNVNWTNLIYYINGVAIDTAFYTDTDGVISFHDPIGITANYVQLKVFATDTARFTAERILRRK